MDVASGLPRSRATEENTAAANARPSPATAIKNRCQASRSMFSHADFKYWRICDFSVAQSRKIPVVPKVLCSWCLDSQAVAYRVKFYCELSLDKIQNQPVEFFRRLLKRQMPGAFNEPELALRQYLLESFSRPHVHSSIPGSPDQQ